MSEAEHHRMTEFKCTGCNGAKFVMGDQPEFSKEDIHFAYKQGVGNFQCGIYVPFRIWKLLAELHEHD